MINVNRLNIKINANPARVIPLFLHLNGKYRIDHIVLKVLELDEKKAEETLNQIFIEFESRHYKFRENIIANYNRIKQYVPSPQNLSDSRKLLLGAYFTKEYSIEAAALFNPSIVAHPDQSGLKEGELRFIMSLRATGEGHISSIEFRTGIISKNGNIILDTLSPKLSSSNKTENPKYSKDFIIKTSKFYNEFHPLVLEKLPHQFSKNEAFNLITNLSNDTEINLISTRKALEEIFDTNYDIIFDKETPLNSRVIFPSSKAESMGMEDVRFVKFTDKNETKYIGTYTAYNGKNIQPQLIETEDFSSFKVRALHGSVVFDKGMALFPEKIDGKYAMIGRQGGEYISIMYSDDLYYWDTYKIIQKPEKEWELIQLGNCGSPVKTSAGWLLLTHAVGPLRKYVISTTLLDLNNPEKVISSLDKPLISPNKEEREGYVPNVVYTCGILQHTGNLIIPYAMSDSASSFAIANVNTLLTELLKK